MTKTQLIKDIANKLNSKLSTEKLQQIAAILGITTSQPKKVVTKKKTTTKTTTKRTSPWLEHVKQFKETHPNLSYREVLKQAKETYTKVGRKPRSEKQKKEKKITEHQCKFCEFKTTDKSNFNRHVKNKHSPNKLKLQLAKHRGLLNRHRTRATSSKNEDIRKESAEIVKTSEKAVREIVNTLKQLDQGTNSKSTTKKVTKKKTATKKKTIPKNIDDLITRINKGYKDNTENDLSLSKAEITSYQKKDGNITIGVKDLSVDDGEKIDAIVLTEHQQGYEATLMQEVEFRGKTTLQEYEEFFVY